VWTTKIGGLKMAKTYKIWAVIEEYDEDTDEHNDLGEELAEVGCYNTLAEAQEALNEMDSYPVV
jgi:uncharacterized NAD-dependent epimerase/dehydratase family protein